MLCSRPGGGEVCSLLERRHPACRSPASCRVYSRTLTHPLTQVVLTLMLKVGLTGSIAVGKSFVLSVFVELGARVLDADATARMVAKPGTPGFKAVVEAFGE